MIKVGINGFGRIGRLTARTILQKYKDKLELVCINTSGRMETKGWAHLFEYDSTYNKYQGEVLTEGDEMIVDGVRIPVLGEQDPSRIPWGKYGAEIVIESTGVFRQTEQAKKHLRASVKRVIISAPPKDDQSTMFVLGVNQDKLGHHKIFSTASCTTNCVAPVIKVLDEAFGIEKAMMTTIHAYTSDQQILDGSHKDLRRARSAAINIIPTTTGAAAATAKVYPKVEKRFDGLAIRVPVKTGSLTDFTLVTKNKTSVEEVNNVFKKASLESLKGILGVSNKPLVSTDVIGLELSSLVDLSLTQVMGGNLVKVIAWYDNEWGYVQRLVESVLLCQS